jgi:arylsulfatase A
MLAAITACRGAPGPTTDPTEPTSPVRRPNVILVFADDLSAGELGCYGQRKIRTPRMDALAAEGVHLTHFDSAAAVCAPSRAMLLCGLHAGHAPIRDNREVGPEGQAPIGAATETIVKDLRRAGYATGLFGKWGLGGPGSGSEPLDCGFDAFTGYLCQRKAHDHYPPSLWEGRTVLPLAGNPPKDPGGATYANDVIRDAAVCFVESNRDRPFFLMFATPLPHLAMQVPAEDLAGYAGAFPETPYDGKNGYLPHPTPRAGYAAMITRLDCDVGAIVDAVRRAGLEHDTVILVTADNGATHDVGGVDTAFFESTGGLRGRKGSHFEGGLRVPFIAWAPGRIAPGRVLDAPAWSVDLRATIDAWCGASAPGGDGRDLSAWLDGRSPAPPAPFRGYWESPGYGGQQAVAWQEGPHLWKAIRQGMNKAGAEAPVMLFDLAADPNEERDRASERADVVADSQRRMAIEHVDSEAFPLRGAGREARSPRVDQSVGAPSGR